MAFEQWKTKFKACFDCNICLDFAFEPILTLCGHLYCWPCIYKWLHVQSASLATDKPPQCPVCKADVAHTTMIPLYGCGQSAEDAGVDAKGLLIPPRPSAFSNKDLAPIRSDNASDEQPIYGDLYQNQNYNDDRYDSYDEDEDTRNSSFNLKHNPVSSFRHPTARMFRELQHGRLFGNSESLYGHPNSYALTGNNSPRSRRCETQAEQSINRMALFLFFFFVVCLVFF